MVTKTKYSHAKSYQSAGYIFGSFFAATISINSLFRGRQRRVGYRHFTYPNPGIESKMVNSWKCNVAKRTE